MNVRRILGAGLVLAALVAGFFLRNATITLQQGHDVPLPYPSGGHVHDSYVAISAVLPLSLLFVIGAVLLVLPVRKRPDSQTEAR